MHVSKELRGIVERYERSNSRWKEENRGKGDRDRMLRERKEAIASDLSRRQENEVRARAAHKIACAQALLTNHLYPASYV